jgi:hypothetical protein
MRDSQMLGGRSRLLYTVLVENRMVVEGNIVPAPP